MVRARRVVLISLAVVSVAGGGVAAAVLVSGKHDKPGSSTRAAAPVDTTDSDTETVDTGTTGSETAEPDTDTTAQSTDGEAAPQATPSQPQQPANDPDLQRQLAALPDGRDPHARHVRRLHLPAARRAAEPDQRAARRRGGLGRGVAGAMASLRAQDEQTATAQYVSDLQYEAERSIQSAKTALSH